MQVHLEKRKWQQFFQIVPDEYKFQLEADLLPRKTAVGIRKVEEPNPLMVPIASEKKTEIKKAQTVNA